MAKRAARNARCIETGTVNDPARKYRREHPLLQGRVPLAVYKEAQRRAGASDFSVSKWLSYWLTWTFAQHPVDR